MDVLGVAVGRALAAALEGQIPECRTVSVAAAAFWSGSAIGLLGFAAANRLPLEVLVDAAAAPSGWVAQTARSVGCHTERTADAPVAPLIVELAGDRNDPVLLSASAGIPTPATWPGAVGVQDALAADLRVLAVAPPGAVDELVLLFGAHRVIAMALDLNARVAVAAGLAAGGWKPIVIEPSWSAPSNGAIEVHLNRLDRPQSAPIVSLRPALPNALAPRDSKISASSRGNAALLGSEVDRRPVLVIVSGFDIVPGSALVAPPGSVVHRVTRLRPFPVADITSAVRHGARVVVALPEPYATEIATIVGERCFYELDAPVVRVRPGIPDELDAAVTALRAT